MAPCNVGDKRSLNARGASALRLETSYYYESNVVPIFMTNGQHAAEHSCRLLALGGLRRGILAFEHRLREKRAVCHRLRRSKVDLENVELAAINRSRISMPYTLLIIT